MRSFRLLLGALAVLPLLGASPALAQTAENRLLSRAVDATCLDGRGSIDTIAGKARALDRTGHDMGNDAGPPFQRMVGLAGLGSGSTVITLTGRDGRSPFDECLFVSYSDNLAELVSDWRVRFGLGAPTRNDIDGTLTARGAVRLGGANRPVRLDYALREDGRAGSFSLAVGR